MIYSLSQFNTIKVGKYTIRVTHEMFVDKIHKLVLGRVLHLIVILCLSEGGEVLSSLELIEVNLNLTGHALASHGLTAVAEEIEIVNTTNNFKIMHDALANQISLLRVSKNGHCFIKVSIVSA